MNKYALLKQNICGSYYLGKLFIIITRMINYTQQTRWKGRSCWAVAADERDRQSADLCWGGSSAVWSVEEEVGMTPEYCRRDVAALCLHFEKQTPSTTHQHYTVTTVHEFSRIVFTIFNVAEVTSFAISARGSYG